MIKFPPSFDINYYREIYPELHGLNDDAVYNHYKKFAKVQGRTTCIYDRSEYMRAFLRENIKDENILEIGAFDRPFCIEGNVKYFDVMDANDLKKRAIECNRIGGYIPRKIDYVSSNGDLSIIKEKFDMAISSHVIEHQPDLIRHLQCVSNVLNDNGLYILFIPDKRYCFDYYIPATFISEIINAYVEQPKVHSFKHVIEHLSMTVHNNPVEHWFGEHGDNEINEKSFSEAVDRFIKSDGKYIDVHAWQFTPKSFQEIIDKLYKMSFINLKIHRLCNTIFGRQEFCAILEKN